MRARLDQVAPVDHLAADEAARDVGVDRLRGVERGLALAQRPGARLLLARGEERDQRRARRAGGGRPPPAPTRRRRGTRPPPPRRAPTARPRARGRSRPGRSRPRAAASSSAARAPAAARRRSRRAATPPSMCASTLPSSSTSTRSFGSPDFACFSTRSSRFSTWSRSATSSSSCRFSRSRAGSASGEKPSSDDEQRVHLAQVPEQRGPGAGHVLHADRRGRDLLRRDDLRQRVEPLVRDLRHADVRLAVLAAAGLRQRREERRLPRAGQAHDSHLERHARSLPPRDVSSRG